MLLPFSLKLKKPLNLKRRVLNSPNPYYYQSELIAVSNSQGQTGYGEVVGSRNLARELAYLHLVLLENNLNIGSGKIAIAGMIDSVNIAEAQELVVQGFKTLKFKISPNWEQEAELLSEIRTKIGPDVDIRLDANRGFELREAIDFGKRVAPLRIAYFEEPLKNIDEIPKFVQATAISVALDETLLEGTPILEGVSTYALKPFLMPSLQSIFDCIGAARERGLDIAICSAFESGYGLSWLVLLAALVQEKQIAAGLSTYRWFAEDLISPPFSVTNGCALVSRAYESLFYQHDGLLYPRISDFSSSSPSK